MPLSNADLIYSLQIIINYIIIILFLINNKNYIMKIKLSTHNNHYILNF